MANENKQAVVTAIWENPERAFNCQFKQSGRYWENLRGDEYDERGKIRLALTNDGGNVMVFYNGASRPEQTDVFTYLGEYVLNTRDFKETLQRLAELYGITLQFSDDERKGMARTALAREVTASLVEYLRTHPDGVTGKYLRDVRKIANDGTHFGELTKESIKAVRDSLSRRGIKYSNDDLEALGIVDYYAEYGYNCVIPYYVNGSVRGFVLRNTRPDCQPKDRYRYSKGLGRGGYCDTLTHGEPAVIVEGQIDAIRLIQAGVRNVIGIGGAKIGEDIARLLKAHGITDVTYIPDNEVTPEQEPDTQLTRNCITALLSATVDGEPVVSNLYVAEIPTPDDWTKYPKYKDGELQGYKIDADTYGKEQGNKALADVVANNTASWAWEIDELCGRVLRRLKTGQTVQFSKIQEQFGAIYSRVGSPFERQRIQRYITDGIEPEYRAILEQSGVTPQALNTADDMRKNTEENNRLRDGSNALSKAIAEGASPERIRAIIQELNDAVTLNTRDEWDGQLFQTFDDALKEIAKQPDTLKTKWEVGTVSKNGTYYKHDTIEYYPADIEVFCAPTSHGKTMILFQSAMDLIATTDKTYLYVSCEENARQLLERAFNVYIDIPTTANGKDENGGYCFKEQTRKKTIKAVVRNDVPPYEYGAPENGGYMGQSEHYDALSKQIRRKIEQYKTNVFPRLKLVHTEATIESICSNIYRTVEDYRRKGVDVGGVFVDYMQLLTTENRNYSRHDELKDICKALKDCAARTELPIIIAAQLNREVLKQGIDSITVANIGEGADIERIAHDIYLVWQIDKTQESLYKSPDAQGNIQFNPRSVNVRSNRLYTKAQLNPNDRTLKTGYIYIERMKARDGKTEGWGLLPYDGERGFIDKNDTAKMAE